MASTDHELQQAKAEAERLRQQMLGYLYGRPLAADTSAGTSGSTSWAWGHPLPAIAPRCRDGWLTGGIPNMSPCGHARHGATGILLSRRARRPCAWRYTTISPCSR